MKLSKNLNYLRPIKINNLFRVGNNADGGYVVPFKTFKKIDTILSFGLGDNFSFEQHALILNNKLNIRVDNSIFGDPIYGHRKFLVIYFKLDNDEYRAVFNEGHTAIINFE